MADQEQEYTPKHPDYSQLALLDDDDEPKEAQEISPSAPVQSPVNGQMFPAQFTGAITQSGLVSGLGDIFHTERRIKTGLSLSPAEGKPYSAYASDGINETVYNFDGHVWRIASKDIRTGRIEVFEQSGSDGRGAVKIIQGKPETVAETHPQNIAPGYQWSLGNVTFKNPLQWDATDRQYMDTASVTPFKWLTDGEDKHSPMTETHGVYMSDTMQRAVAHYVDKQAYSTAQMAESIDRLGTEGSRLEWGEDVSARPGLKTLNSLVPQATRAKMEAEGTNRAAVLNAFEARRQEMSELGRTIEKNPELATADMAAQITKGIGANDGNYGIEYRALETARILIEKRRDLITPELTTSIKAIATREPTYHREQDWDNGFLSTGRMKLVRDEIYDAAGVAYKALKENRPDLAAAPTSGVSQKQDGQISVSRQASRSNYRLHGRDADSI